MIGERENGLFQGAFYPGSEIRLYLQHFLPRPDDADGPGGDSQAGFCLYGGVHPAVFLLAGHGK